VRQIDCILTDAVAVGCFCSWEIVDTLDGASDHRAFCAVLYFEHFERQQIRKYKSAKLQFGWSPDLDENGQPQRYHARLDAALASHTLTHDPTHLIVDAAVGSGHTLKNRTAQGHSLETQTLFAERRAAMDPDRRRQLSKQLWRSLRTDKRRRQQQEIEAALLSGAGLKALQRLDQRHAGVERTLRIQDTEGHVHTDQASISEVFALFYEDLYRASDSDDGMPREFLGVDVVTEAELRRALGKGGQVQMTGWLPKC
jgi:hypothetical protein